MATDAEDLLHRLTAGEETSLRTVMALNPEPVDDRPVPERPLPPRTRTLVRLAALVAVDAPTTSLRWAVERALCAGAREDEIVSVLEIVSCEAGLACAVSAAPRLALAIGYDMELGDWDGL